MRISREIRDLIRKKVAFENGWGALRMDCARSTTVLVDPIEIIQQARLFQYRVNGELLKLGFDVNERIISRYLTRRPVSPDALKRWIAFLRNHREVITRVDFFTVPSGTFQVLYVFSIIRHDRRQSGIHSKYEWRGAA